MFLRTSVASIKHRKAYAVNHALESVERIFEMINGPRVCKFDRRDSSPNSPTTENPTLHSLSSHNHNLRISFCFQLLSVIRIFKTGGVRRSVRLSVSCVLVGTATEHLRSLFLSKCAPSHIHSFIHPFIHLRCSFIHFFI